MNLIINHDFPLSPTTDLSKQQYDGEYTEAIAAGIQDRRVPETGNMPAIALRR